MFPADTLERRIPVMGDHRRKSLAAHELDESPDNLAVIVYDQNLTVDHIAFTFSMSLTGYTTSISRSRYGCTECSIPRNRIPVSPGCKVLLIRPAMIPVALIEQRRAAEFAPSRAARTGTETGECQLILLDQ